MRTATVQLAAKDAMQSYLWQVGLSRALFGSLILGITCPSPLSLGKVHATTIPLDSITLGAVIQINGQNFVKIGDNRYLSVCAIESNKCLIKGQEWDETAGKCVCTQATASIQNWNGCSSLSVWQEDESIADNSNTVCLLDRRDDTFYQAHKHSDNRCYVTSATNDTPVRVDLVCPEGQMYSSTLQGCYQVNGCSNPTAYMQN